MQELVVESVVVSLSMVMFDVLVDETAHLPLALSGRLMRRFKSPAHLQRFAAVHGVVQNLFRVGRHRLRSVHHRLLRRRAFAEWDVVTCAC